MDTEQYRVALYERCPQRLAVVFVSAGRLAPGGTVEEFRNTLSGFGWSCCFVTDHNATWFNAEETETMWAALVPVAAGFETVVTLGESMGGCGALAARHVLPQASRTLAFAPQFSIMKPFINFDGRYDAVARRLPRVRYAHYGGLAPAESCTMLFGCLDWRDYLHSTMFAAAGFEPVYLDGAAHHVAAYLKSRPGNALVRLLGDFLANPSFGPDAVRALLPGIALAPGRHRIAAFCGEAALGLDIADSLAQAFARETGERLGRNVAQGKPADQSSHSPHSKGATRVDDAAGAVCGAIGEAASFHTELELDPWWQVDLGTPHAVQEIRLFNVIGEEALSRRANHLDVLVSGDGCTWNCVFQRRSDAWFGGADGRPLVWRPGAVLVTRFVRVQLRGFDWFHLNQVQVFGHLTCQSG